MKRRYRRVQEIPFSLDSFLDLVANVVGIIIRLILVAWVGARSYSSVTSRPALPAPAPPPALSTDPLAQEVARRRQELAAVQQALLAELRQLPALEQKTQHLQDRLQVLRQQRQALARVPSEKSSASASGAAPAEDLEQLRRRCQQLTAAIEELRRRPMTYHVLRYRVPISRPVVEEELHFECKAGRVTFIDFRTFFEEIRATVQERRQELLQNGQLEGVTQPSGAFRLRYRLRWQPLSSGGRLEHTCVVEPLTEVRGESAEAALAPGSAFRQLVESADPGQTVITFWVYPDSFSLFRQLRDYLYERQLAVAARPLPADLPIAESSQGSRSRAQ